MSSGFITETEALEARRLRQEEWDKVRTEDQPKEAPEEPYDNRPLYHRLEEQRLKKEAEYEETHKLKNMIRGLDDDEVGFLDLVERTKAKVAQAISIEEQKEMQEFRERVSNLAETEEMQRLRAQVATKPSARATPPASQKNKLQGMVVRKRKASELDNENKDKEKEATPAKVNGVAANETTVSSNGATPSSEDMGALHCVGVLPGLGHYDTDTSSDTDDSSEDESEICTVKRDLCGRRADQSHEVQEKTREQSKS